MPTKEERQTLMFSATFPRDIQDLAREFLKPHHAFITVGTVGAANRDIVQIIERVDNYSKKDRLFEMLQSDIQNSQPGESNCINCVCIRFVLSSSIFSRRSLPKKDVGIC